MRPLTRPGQRHLLNQIVRFSRSLHAAGVPVSTSSLIDLCQCLTLIDIGKKTDFYATMQTTLVSSKDDIPVFNQIFNEFWCPPDEFGKVMQDNAEEANTEETSKAEKQQNPGLDHRADAADHGQQHDPDETLPGYSEDEVLMKKDFALMSDKEIEQARRLITGLIAILANYKSRRRMSSPKGSELNFRKMLRQNAYYAMEGTELLYRKKRIKNTKLILLGDVSGSMERYSRFLIQFIYALRQQLAGLDVAVFSTRMTVITDSLKRQDVAQSLREVSASVHDWAGGTNIGGCLREFNQRFARDMTHARTIVIILSDGWDRGDAALMRSEIELLHRRVHRLLWLNPLLGNASYQPLCKGVQTALPYIDHFLPAHNLESFANLVRYLRTAWR